jgi:dihydroflavonol-4-reductase
MKVLITGASGFLGAHLCRRMAAEGHSLRILCRPTSDLSNLKGLPFDQVTGDVTDPEAVRRAVQGCEAVIHAAAVLSYWGRDAARQASVNVEGTRHVAQACRTGGVKRLVHISSVAAVGIPEDPRQPANEEFRFNLEHSGLNYHLSKRRAEEAVLAEVTRGLDAVIVNPATVFGPHGRMYRGLEMIEKVRQRRIVPYFTGGICVVHVEDVVEGVLAALDRGETGQRYILGGENVTYRGVVERAAEAMHLRRRFVAIPRVVTYLAASLLEPLGRLRNRRPAITYTTHYGASRYHFYDSSKARQALGYASRNFDAILEDCLRFAGLHGDGVAA